MSSGCADEMKTAVIFGATGAVGKPLLSHLLSSPQYSKVHAIVRRPFKENSEFKEETKLQEHIIDFEELLKDGSASNPAKTVGKVKASAVYITLGTTRGQAGSSANFIKIDQDYVVAGAKAALSEEKENKQRLIYCSSAGANTKSRLPYLHSKGMTEDRLTKLGYSECILFRPAYLSGAQRDRTKVGEKIFGSIMTNIGGRISDNAEIQLSDVAKAIAVAGIKGTAALASQGYGTVKQVDGSESVLINNVEAKKLAREA